LNRQEWYKPQGTAKILTKLIQTGGKILCVIYNNKEVLGKLKNKSLHSLKE